jgi:hypothetical protein
MDARNKWTEARKVMKKTELLRVSFGEEGGFPHRKRNEQCRE